MPVSRNICVYCSSSDAIDQYYLDEARRLGEEIASRGYSLVYGGGDIGSMGVLARTVQSAGGRVIGVIPTALNKPGIGFSSADELIVTETMRERKAVMESSADAFITLPGGVGTFEEILETITLKQLSYHTKPIAILNSRGYYDPLLQLFDKAVMEMFMKDKTLELFQ